MGAGRGRGRFLTVYYIGRQAKIASPVCLPLVLWSGVVFSRLPFVFTDIYIFLYLYMVYHVCYFPIN